MKRIFQILFLLSTLSGCKVGPNYTSPDTPLPDKFIEQKPTEKSISIENEDLVHWWEEAFHDHFLDDLMERTLHSNLDLAIAIRKSVPS